MRTYLKSKIHPVQVDNIRLDYEGSIIIPVEMMTEYNIDACEQVHVFDINNGHRFITYAMPGEELCVCGAASRLVEIGDLLTILTYEIK